MARVTVMEWERVARFRDGLLVGVLGPGRHRSPRRRTRLVRVDVRPRLLTVPGQEVLTADGLTVRVSVLVRWSVVDTAAFVRDAAPADLLYAEVQLALRDAVGDLPLDDVVRRRAALGAQLSAAVQPAAASVGVGVDSVAVKDVMLPGELRQALAETALAQEEGKASLERARSESAALRSLANTARLLEEHPALLHLRTLQAVDGSGATVVLTPPQR